ncbi:MAG: DEAD/DEAH box helicase family protein, partial [Prosthecobacter sp.]|nr:DEAD/DEAH box helicase family protein [Prosthecobacter sp.]
GEKDLVVKLNTGGGKTTIGLLYLKHLMDKHRRPAVYLVPNIQLVEQVVAEGKNIGLPVFHWKAGESHAPEEALRCTGVIACTYDKFFNGRSTFARQRITPCALVLDDVHAGVETVRQSFSAELPSDVYQKLINLLGDGLEEHDPVAWAGINKGAADAIVEVPFWLQQRHQTAITSLITAYSESDELKFTWANISPAIETSRLFLSGRNAYVTLDPPHIERVPHYVGASHRLFMSASVHDGGVLVRELGCEPDAARKPVDASEETSIGERLVIVPSLIEPEFSDESLVRVALAIRPHANVVVLVPSFGHAKKWAEVGATVAKPESISEVIENLRRSPAGAIAVFVQRYDGVDLPDNACRLLIVDGLPVAENLADRHESSNTSAIAGMRGKVAVKIEQGLGRAVRSSSDYCAVILGGREIAGFISRSEVARNLSPFTVRQLEIGRSVSAALRGTKDVTQGVVDTVAQLLRRDPGWKMFYQQEIAKTVISEDVQSFIDRKIDVANFEREAVKCVQARDFVTANRFAQRAADSVNELEFRGVIKQTAARYQNFYDNSGAMQLQVSAYGDNPHISRPPMLLPSQVRKVTSQAESISNWLRSFTDPNGPLIAIDDLRSKASFEADSRTVEAMMQELGRVLGAESNRPDKEFNRGPDNLWIFGEDAFVIEVKSQKSASFSKGDAEQLQSSIQWVEQNYRGISKVYAFVVSDVFHADVIADFAFGAHVWRQEDVYSIIDRIRRMSIAAITHGELFLASPANIQGMLGPNELLPGQLRSLGANIQQRRGR